MKQDIRVKKENGKSYPLKTKNYKLKKWKDVIKEK